MTAQANSLGLKAGEGVRQWSGGRSRHSAGRHSAHHSHLERPPAESLKVSDYSQEKLSQITLKLSTTARSVGSIAGHRSSGAEAIIWYA